MNINDIQWPIYTMKPNTETFTEYNVLYAKTHSGDKVIDNRNLNGKTMGLRRLSIPPEDLYTFGNTLFTLSELVHYTSTVLKQNRCFVDSAGIFFKYIKKKVYPLIWRKVISVEKFTSFVVLHIADIPNTFEMPNIYWNKSKYYAETYLGLLKYDDHYIIYDIADGYVKDTWRKI